MRKTILQLLFFIPLLAISQVGIWTESPQSTLDVREQDPSNPTNFAGIALPQINSLPTLGNRAGQMVFLTTLNIFYYFNGTSWTCLNCTLIGNVKYSFQENDHGHWVKLDGRALTSLTSQQQIQASTLGFASNLPNASNRILKSKGSLGDVGGRGSITLSRANLPNVNFTGVTDVAGGHNHTNVDHSHEGQRQIRRRDNNSSDRGTETNNRNTGNQSAHSHSGIVVASGGSGAAINIENPYLSVNVFINLGPNQE